MGADSRFQTDHRYLDRRAVGVRAALSVVLVTTIACIIFAILECLASGVRCRWRMGGRTTKGIVEGLRHKHNLSMN